MGRAARGSLGEKRGRACGGSRFIGIYCRRARYAHDTHTNIRRRRGVTSWWNLQSTVSSNALSYRTEYRGGIGRHASRLLLYAGQKRRQTVFREKITLHNLPPSRIFAVEQRTPRHAPAQRPLFAGCFLVWTVRMLPPTPNIYCSDLGHKRFVSCGPQCRTITNTHQQQAGPHRTQDHTHRYWRHAHTFMASATCSLAAHVLALAHPPTPPARPIPWWICSRSPLPSPAAAAEHAEDL